MASAMQLGVSPKPSAVRDPHVPHIQNCSMSRSARGRAVETSANADSAGRTRLDSLGSSAGPTPSCATAPSIKPPSFPCWPRAATWTAVTGWPSWATGESHLLIGLGIAASKQGRQVCELCRTGQRVWGSGRRAEFVPSSGPPSATRPVLPRRARQCPARRPRSRAMFLILTWRENKASGRHRLQPALLRMEPGHRRSPPGGCHRGLAHLQRPHHRDRHRELPNESRQGQAGDREEELLTAPAGGRC